MAGTFANTVFSSGAQDSYRAVDVYTQSGKGTISSYQDTSSAPSSSGLGSLFGGGTTGFSLSTVDALKTAQNTVAYGKGVMSATDNKSALDRAIGSMGSLASNLRSAPGGLQASLLSGIGSTQNIYATIGNVTSRLKSGNLPDIRSLSGMINSVAGQTNPPLLNINDNNSIVGLTAGLVQQACRSGIPNSFSALTKNLTSNPTLLAGVVNKVMPTITKTGNVRQLKDVVSVAPVEVKASAPNILSDFSFNYQKDDGTVGTAVTDFSDIKSTYSAIDPSWNTATREGGTATDLSCFAKASPDMKDTLKIGALNSTDPNDKLYLLADHIPNTDPRDQLKQQFPMTAYADVSEPQATVLSPEQTSIESTTKDTGTITLPSGTTRNTSVTSYADGSTRTTIVSTYPDGTSDTDYKYTNGQGTGSKIAGPADTWGSSKKIDAYVKDDIEYEVYTQTNSQGFTRKTTLRSYVNGGQLTPLIEYS